MKIDFNKGYIILGEGEPFFICPHSGPSIEVPTNRDDYSDTIASLCWMKSGGSFMISTMPRKAGFGIDFNRTVPDKEEAIDIWEDFIEDKNPEDLKKFRDKFSFACKDEEDYNNRVSIYNNFWREAEAFKNLVFIHRKFTRLKNYPSIIDVITYSGKGVDMEKAQSSINKANEKYAGFFKQIEDDYKQAILLETKRVLERITRLYGFELGKIKLEYKEHILKDLEIIKSFASPDIVSDLLNNFTEDNFMAAAEDVLHLAGPPLVTLERIFKGAKAQETKALLFKNRNMIEFECNAFIGYWYPKEASEIILDILKDLGIIN